MSLKLAFERYDELELLGKALGNLHDHTFQRFSALCKARDRGKNDLSRDEFVELFDLAVCQVLTASRMLGKIILAILEQNPVYGHTKRPHWDQVNPDVPITADQRATRARREAEFNREMEELKARLATMDGISSN